MKVHGVQKNSVVFTSAINVAHKFGDVSDATRWFDQMLAEGKINTMQSSKSIISLLS
jgi:hypothetical protein